MLKAEIDGHVKKETDRQIDRDGQIDNTKP